MIAVSKTHFVGAAYKKKLVETKNGKSMLSFTLRTWRPTKSGIDKVCFFDVVAYAAAAEVLNRYLYDGKVIYLDCTADQYKTQDGEIKIQFIVNEFSFMGGETVQDS